MAKQKTILPIVALVTAYVLWGFNVPVIKVGIATIPLVVFMVTRFLAASFILLPFAIRTWKPLKRRDLLIMIISSIIWIMVTALTLNVGLLYAPSMNAGVINLLGPLILCILSVEFLKERMSLKTFIGILVAFAGAAVIIGKPWEVSVTGQSVLLGNTLYLASMLGAVISAIIAKPILKKMSSYQAAFMYVFPGALCLIPIAITQLDGWSVSEISAKSYMAITYSIIAITLANLFFMYGLKYKQANEVGIFQYLESVALFIGAWFLLGERPSAKFAAGAVLVFIGIYLAEFHMPKKQKFRFRRSKWYTHLAAKFH
jgi:drug/metabolite transporter (DMT)-like permease